MTEDEAKTKWCPFVRYTVEQEEGVTPARNAWIEYSKKQRIPEMARCIASQCMAWRWLPLLADEAFKAAVIKAAADIGDKTENKHKAAQHVIANRAAYGLPTKPFDGFCGLAGTP